MSAILIPVTARIAAALDTANGTGEHETAMRLMKVVEEAGEASAAYIGMTGQNPRKGVTHTPADVADELCDVIIAATVALHAFTTTPPAVLNAKLHAVARRLDTATSPATDTAPAGVETEPEWPTASEAYADAPDISSEIGWTTETSACTPMSQGLDREYFLRKAAVLDRMALAAHHQKSDDIARAANEVGHILMRLDDTALTCDPRAYIRRQYALWTTQH
ncbi:MazG-like family protein [Streptomyces sp. NPDC101455]|uniref:MazG-like family protein n=1 Tax=Streptomyces sp. NPDC101455 TaxID=3366142 RepID=UPI00382398E0